MNASAHSVFPRSHRLSGKLLFAAVYDAKVKVSGGPLVVFSVPNELGHLRMGISISRKVGTAPRRNRIKRLLRESFRLSKPAVPQGYDLVIVVRPHVPMQLPAYQQLLTQLVSKINQRWNAAK